MSKTISVELKAHLASEVTTIATCLKLVRLDGAEYFFTDHDTDLTIDGDTYEATDGMIPTSISQSNGLSVDNMEIVALLGFDRVEEADIAAGLFDYAAVDIFIVNYQDLTMGVMYLLKGWTIGSVEIRDNTFQAEIRGKAQRLQQNLCETYTPECRAELGDSRCGVDIEDSAQTYWASGTVTAVSDRKIFADSSLGSEAYEVDVFVYGKLTWSEPGSGDSYTGNNAGREMEIKAFNNGNGAFELFEAMPEDIEVGDEFVVTFGCDKDIETCKNRFNNVVNFRGEPFIPGWDRVMDIIIN